MTHSSVQPCGCDLSHPPRFVVVTGGPGAGKTAVLEIAQRHFCQHVVVLPESASMLFRGGFPRSSTRSGKKATQRAIYRVQHELEEVASIESGAAVVLCDRGTLDGLAYWPEDFASFFGELGTSEAAELVRYAAVIHLRTPSAHDGYDRTNPLRVETASEAQRIDERIGEAWKRHPRVLAVPTADDFITKARTAITVITEEVREWCGPRTVRPGGREPHVQSSLQTGGA